MKDILISLILILVSSAAAQQNNEFYNDAALVKFKQEDKSMFGVMFICFKLLQTSKIMA